MGRGLGPGAGARAGVLDKQSEALVWSRGSGSVGWVYGHGIGPRAWAWVWARVFGQGLGPGAGTRGWDQGRDQGRGGV